jgi:hypothetical protein
VKASRPPWLEWGILLWRLRVHGIIVAVSNPLPAVPKFWSVQDETQRIRNLKAKGTCATESSTT